MIETNTLVVPTKVNSGRIVDIKSYELLVDGNKIPDGQAIVREQGMGGVALYNVNISSNGLSRFAGYRPSDFPDNVQRLLVDSSDLEFQDVPY